MGLCGSGRSARSAGRTVHISRAPYTLRTVLKCCDLLRFVMVPPVDRPRPVSEKVSKGQQRSAKVSLSGDGRFDPSQCPRAAAPSTGAGRMFHICSQRSGFKGPRRRLVAFAAPCRRGASVSLRHHMTACRTNPQFRHKLGSGNDRVIGFARILLQQAAEKLGAGAVLRKNRSKCAARLNLSCVLARGFESMLLNATPQKRFSAAC